MPDALDLQIISALQLSPRIPWRTLSGVLHTDASTLSRRWQHLLARKEVWTSCIHTTYSTSSEQSLPAMAFTEVRCRPGTRQQVVDALVPFQRVVSVHCTSGRRDLYLTLVGKSVGEIDVFIETNIACIGGIEELSTHFVRRLYLEGGSWRLRRLSVAQQELIAATRPHLEVPVPTPSLLHLISSIQSNIRVPVAVLARQSGRSMSSVSRDMDLLLSAPWASWRIDFTSGIASSGIAAMIWMRVPQVSLDSTAETACNIHASRMVVSATGEANLAVFIWLWNLLDIDNFERAITQAHPDAEIIDRWLVPRVAKRVGAVLDSSGNQIGYIPVRDSSTTR